MKLTLSLLIVSLCLRASAQTAPTPLVDTNAIAKARAAALAFQSTNVVVPVPMDTTTLTLYPMVYPAAFPVGANLMYSTNLVWWKFVLEFDITKTNIITVTNPQSEPHFWRVALQPPMVMSIQGSNYVNAITNISTNAVTNSISSSK
jgi:hypothetical protein